METTKYEKKGGNARLVVGGNQRYFNMQVVFQDKKKNKQEG